MIKVDIEMPKNCSSCPFYKRDNDYYEDMGRCSLLPIKDLNGDVVEHQIVNGCYRESGNNIRTEGRSKHCPLIEVKR